MQKFTITFLFVLQTPIDMNKLLLRSNEFEKALHGILRTDGIELFDSTPKLRVCAHACLLSIEHAASVRILFSADAPHSASALLRLQYEALLRAAWVLYAASDCRRRLKTEPLGVRRKTWTGLCRTYSGSVFGRRQQLWSISVNFFGVLSHSDLDS
ncbi:MAG: hypothetical protein Q7K57_02085 [Burkholderiaceae bacterium]|nr:hypothetical protein [Burkholderiaceae bacterium]